MSTVPLRATSYLKDNKPMRASTTSGMARGSVIENVSPLGDDEGETARFQRWILFEIRKRRPGSLAERIAQFHRLRHALLQTGMDGVANALFGKMIQCAKAGADFLSVGFQFSIRVAHHFQAPLIMVVLPDQSREACSGLRVRRPRVWLRARNSSWYSALTSTACQASSWSSRSINW